MRPGPQFAPTSLALLCLLLTIWSVGNTGLQLTSAVGTKLGHSESKAEFLLSEVNDKSYKKKVVKKIGSLSKYRGNKNRRLNLNKKDAFVHTKNHDRKVIGSFKTFKTNTSLNENRTFPVTKAKVTMYIPVSHVTSHDHSNDVYPMWNKWANSIHTIFSFFWKNDFWSRNNQTNFSLSQNSFHSKSLSDNGITKDSLLDRKRGVYFNEARRKRRKRSLNLHTKQELELWRSEHSKAKNSGTALSHTRRPSQSKRSNEEDDIDNSKGKLDYSTDHAYEDMNDEAWLADSSPLLRDNQLAPPPPAFGLFATVQELVKTIKELNKQQIKDRRNMRQLKRRYEEQSRQLAVTTDLAEECKTRIRRLETSLGNLDAKMAENEVEVRDLRSRTLENFERGQGLARAVTDVRSEQNNIQHRVAQVEDEVDLWDEKLVVVEKDLQKQIRQILQDVEMKISDSLKNGLKGRSIINEHQSTQSSENILRRGDMKQFHESSELESNFTKEHNTNLSGQASLNLSFITQDSATEYPDQQGKTDGRMQDEQADMVKSRRRTRRNDKDDEQDLEIAQSPIFHDEAISVTEFERIGTSFQTQKLSTNDIKTVLMSSVADESKYVINSFPSSSIHHSLLSPVENPVPSAYAALLSLSPSKLEDQINGMFEDNISTEPSDHNMPLSSHSTTPSNCDSVLGLIHDDCYSKRHPIAQSQSIIKSQMTPIDLQSSQHYHQFESRFELPVSSSKLNYLPTPLLSSDLYPSSLDASSEESVLKQIQPTPSLQPSINIQDAKSKSSKSNFEYKPSGTFQDLLQHRSGFEQSETKLTNPPTNPSSPSFLVASNDMSEHFRSQNFDSELYSAYDSSFSGASMLEVLTATDAVIPPFYTSFSEDNETPMSVEPASEPTFMSYPVLQVYDSFSTVSESSLSAQNQIPLASKFFKPTLSSSYLVISSLSVASNGKSKEQGLVVQIDELFNMVKEFVVNETAQIQFELEKQRQDLRKSWQSIRDELMKRDISAQRLESVVNETSTAIKQLGNKVKVSTLNTEDFMTKTEEILDKLTDDVQNQRAWRTSFHHALNVTGQNEKELHTLQQIQTNALKRLAQLEDSTATFQALTQRWYRNLQGHVIRLNNSAQDMREQMNRKLDSQQVKTLRTEDIASRSEVQTEIDSLRIQLLYNANRLGSLETSLLNATLTSCRRSALEDKQAEKLLDLQERYENAQTETYLLKEKVKQTDLNLFLARKQISDNLRATQSLETQIRDFGPSLPALTSLSRDVGNMVEQVLPDCHAYFQMGYHTSDVYTIHPGTLGKTVRVFCVMEDDPEQEQEVLTSLEEGKTVIDQTDEEAFNTGSERFSSKPDQTTSSLEGRDGLSLSSMRSFSATDSTMGERETSLAGDVLEMAKQVPGGNGLEDESDTQSGKQLQREDERTPGSKTQTQDISEDSSFKLSQRKNVKRRRRQKNKGKPNPKNRRAKKKRRRRDTQTTEKRRKIQNQTWQQIGSDNTPITSNTKNQNQRSQTGENTTDSIDLELGLQKPQGDAPQQNPIKGGGWTVIQRRVDGQVNFTQTWADYAAGFGDVERGEDHRLGNEALHHLTKREPLQLRIVMEDVFSSVWEARYTRFRVAGRGDNYRIQLSGYHGNATNSLGQCDRMTFSTVDRPGERGTGGEHCARYNGAGWWYPQCHVSNLNGPFPLGMLWFNNAWFDWVQIKSSLMMVRPQEESHRWP